MMEKICHHFFYYLKNITWKGANYIWQSKKRIQEERKIIKETKYCEVYKAVSIIDDDYYSSIEKIRVKSKERDEVRFALY